jgi:arylsulfatase A-like enzyme/predicted negative regulator of RcsB-dependent stress response
MTRRTSIALSLLVALSAACNRGSSSVRANTPIIVITVDTLRSDRLPVYGYRNIETPAIDAFRNDAILFERAYSQCPLTLVAHASMFTGTLPSEHGVHDNIGFTLGRNHKTIGELAKAKGYATGGAVSAIVLRGETGISRGFDFWNDDVDIDPSSLSMGRAQRGGDETREAARGFLSQQSGKPFLFFFHIYEPHTPYEPLPEFRAKYGETYDADVASADAIVGRFLDDLRAQGLYDDAMIVLVSDHGEGLGDHGEYEHGVFLYREAIQVPLLLKLPKSARGGESVATPVQLTDVYATIAKAIGSENKNADAVSLLDIAGGAKPDRIIYSETFYPRFHFGWSEVRSAISGDHHYIQAPKPELYNVVADPAEKQNRMSEERRAYNALRQRIAPYVKDASAPQAVDSEHAQQLAALGYIGSSASTAPGEVLPDAKDHIGQIDEMKKGLVLFTEQKYEEAVTIFSALLEQNPRMIDLWSMQSRALAKLGRRAEAIEAAKQGLRASPSATNLAISVAMLSLDLGRLDDAEQHAKLALKDIPSQAHYLLSQVALKRKDFATARREALATVSGQRGTPNSMMLLGQIALEEGKHEEALTQFEHALAEINAKKRQPIPNLHFFRGDALARLGRANEAEQAFREEIRLFPSEAQPYKNLMLMYVLQGRIQDATQLVFALEKAAPTPPSYVAIAETLKTVGDDRGARYWTARGLKQYPNDPLLRDLWSGRL